MQTKKKLNWKRELPFVAFILPAFLIYVIVTIIPTVGTLGYSFTDFDGFARNVNFVGLDNYIKIFKSPNVVQSILNSLIYGFATPILITALAIPLALALNSKIKSKNILRAVFFFPSVISSLFLGYIWKFILSPSTTGMINGILTKMGKDPLLLLADGKMAMVFLILVTVWTSTGWHACIYIANLQTISPDYYEAATMDGASKWQQFWKITFPMLAPSMTTSVMLLLTSGLKAFDLPFALTEGGPGHATTMITQTIINEGITANQVGFSSAMSFLFLLIISVLTMVQTTVMRRREAKLYE